MLGDKLAVLLKAFQLSPAELKAMLATCPSLLTRSLDTLQVTSGAG